MSDKDDLIRAISILQVRAEDQQLYLEPRPGDGYKFRLEVDACGLTTEDAELFARVLGVQEIVQERVR